VAALHPAKSPARRRPRSSVAAIWATSAASSPWPIPSIARSGRVLIANTHVQVAGLGFGLPWACFASPYSSIGSFTVSTSSPSPLFPCRVGSNFKFVHQPAHARQSEPQASRGGEAVAQSLPDVHDSRAIVRCDDLNAHSAGAVDSFQLDFALPGVGKQCCAPALKSPWQSGWRRPKKKRARRQQSSLLRATTISCRSLFATRISPTATNHSPLSS